MTDTVTAIIATPPHALVLVHQDDCERPEVEVDQAIRDGRIRLIERCRTCWAHTDPAKPPATAARAERDESGRRVLDRWREANLREVVLPSGMTLKIVRQNVEMMLMFRRFRPELVPMAIRFATKPVALDTLDAQEVIQWLAVVDAMAANAIRRIQDPESGEWRELRLEPEDLDQLDARDVAALQQLALRQKTEAQVTAESRAALAAPADAGTMEPAGSDDEEAAP